MHRQNFHSDSSPRQCPVPACPKRKTFEKRSAFVAHLAKKYPQQKEEFMPSKTKKRKSLPQTINWITTRCLYPGCVSNFQYTPTRHIFPASSYPAWKYTPRMLGHTCRPLSRKSNFFNAGGAKSSDGAGIFCGCSGGSVLL
jgi:hypothetical protein